MDKKPLKPPQSRRGKKTKISRHFLGPVLDLEEHVSSDWWKNIFNALYLKTDADVVDDSRITEQEIDLFLEILNVPPESTILDLCCGQGRHSMEFYRRGYKNVEGLDRSHFLIQKAKTRAKRENLNIRFREGDARKLPYPPDTFDIVTILGNSFGYFDTINDDLLVLKEVFRVLKPWGKILVDVADGEYLKTNYQARSWEWIDNKHFVCRERSLSHDGQRLISREVINNAERGIIADQFYAERLYTRESLSELFNNLSFREFNIHTEMTPDSQRNQDLGMMERRLIATALVKKEWTVVKKKRDAVSKDIIVIMGDPNKPDPLKPLRKFDDDDFYTIDQLKDALRKLEKYNFSYLNTHDTLMQELVKQKSKDALYFNLCDEGFNNLPVQELHVPALLEVIGLPYTGSDPQCLAYCYDKSLIRGIASEINIPVPKAFFINPEDTTFDFTFDFPVIVKPNYGDSSFGITQKSVAYNTDELFSALSDIRSKFGYEKPILVEEFLTGKDITVGIIGNPPDSYMFLPIIAEDYSVLPDDLPKICGYEAKWDPTSPYWQLKSIPAELPDHTEKFIEQCCLKLYDRLELRDYARFDWRLNEQGTPKLLEVNPNPGWCWDGHLAKMAGIAGLNYSEMLEAILKAAEQRTKTFGQNQ